MTKIFFALTLVISLNSHAVNTLAQDQKWLCKAVALKQGLKCFKIDDESTETLCLALVHGPRNTCNDITGKNERKMCLALEPNTRGECLKVLNSDQQQLCLALSDSRYKSCDNLKHNDNLWNMCLGMNQKLPMYCNNIRI